MMRDLNNVFPLHPEVDITKLTDLIDAAEDGGLSFYVMNSGRSPMHLAFEMIGDDTSAAALSAARELMRLFDEDDQARADLSDYALAIGVAYHEFVAADGVWRDVGRATA